MPTTASIMVALRAKTKNFDRGMKSAKRHLAEFSSSAALVGKRVAAFGVLTGTAAVAGLAALTKSSLTSIDATAKLADRLGDSTERIQGLRHAAELTGAGSESLDKGLEQLAKRMGELQFKTGEASYAVDRLGLDSEKLVRMSPTEQFAEIADALGQIPTASERAALAYTLFGRTGIKLANTLALGSEGLKSATDEARKLGVAFTRIDAAKVEQANDAMFRLKQVFTGIGNTMAITIAPAITNLTNQLLDIGTAGEGVGEKIYNAMIQVVEVVAAVRGSFYNLKASILEIGADGARAFNTMVTGAMRVRQAAWAVGHDAKILLFGKSLRPGSRDSARLVNPVSAFKGVANIGDTTLVKQFIEDAAAAREQADSVMIGTLSAFIRTPGIGLGSARSLASGSGSTASPMLSFGGETSVGALREGSVEAYSAARKNERNGERISRLLDDQKRQDAQRNQLISTSNTILKQQLSHLLGVEVV